MALRSKLLTLSLFMTLVAGLALASSPASASGVFANATPIAIPDSGTASPYPSSIDVQGQQGRITGIGVQLRALSHTYPSDLDVLLVSPSGRTSIVMSDACGDDDVAATFTFSQLAFENLPADDCRGTVYRPRDYAGLGGESWPGASSGPHAADLDRFVGDEPNGTWSLRVVDDRGGNSGRINGGWQLTITTAVPDAVVPAPGQGGRANPYPLTRTVGGMTGVISDLDVSLSRVYHDRLDDLDLLLVGPDGQRVMLMSDACGASIARDASWGWDDEAAAAMGTTACPTGTYKPTNYESDAMPTPAPGLPHEPFLSRLDYTDPNGEWRLYAYDDNSNDAGGFFVQRFGLQIQTRPKAMVTFIDGAVELNEGQTGELALFRNSGGRGSGDGTVRVTSSPLNATSGSDFKPISTTVALPRGEINKTVPIEALADSVPEGTERFAVTIGSATGDAEPGTQRSAVVTIRDRTVRPPAPGDAPTPAPKPGRGAGSPGPSGDREAPTIGRLALTRSRFAVARRATARAAARRGTRIRYTLSEPATVTLRIRRARRGRRVARYVRVGALRRIGRTGVNRIRFSGRIGRRPLRRGRYRLIATATDSAGNRSASRTRAFRIVR